MPRCIKLNGIRIRFMNDREAFLLLLSYLLPFGGIIHIIWGIDIGNNSETVFGIVCLLATIPIMGYLLYSAKKEKRLLKYGAKKIRLLINMFCHILASCVLMVAEYLILRNFGFEIQYIILIICLSLVIMTIIVNFLQKF